MVSDSSQYQTIKIEKGIKEIIDKIGHSDLKLKLSDPKLLIFVKLIKSIAEISPELKNELERVVFDPVKAFIKFNLDEYHFDFLPSLVAFFHKDFRKCYNKKEIGEIDGVQINIISKEDLLLDKEKLRRDKDLADIENLKKNSLKGFSR